MDKFRSKTLLIFASLVLVFSTALFSPHAAANSMDDDKFKGPAMVFDLLFARPIGLVGTALGSAVFVVSLPFTLLGGNVGEAGKVLVIDPVKFTFVRPLGE